MNYEVQFLIALTETIVIETVGLCLLSFLLWKKGGSQPTFWQIVSAGILATGLTLPYLWFVLPAFWSGSLYVWGGEILITLMEFLMLKRLLPITYLQAFMASVSVNLLSVLVGYYWL